MINYRHPSRHPKISLVKRAPIEPWPHTFEPFAPTSWWTDAELKQYARQEYVPVGTNSLPSWIYTTVLDEL